jgi:hypothetical protein
VWEPQGATAAHRQIQGVRNWSPLLRPHLHPKNRGGLFRTPPNTTLAVDFATVTKRKRKRKLPRMDDRAIAASSDVEARQPTHSNSQLNGRRVTISVENRIDRMSYLRAKINTKLTELDIFSQQDCYRCAVLQHRATAPKGPSVLTHRWRHGTQPLEYLVRHDRSPCESTMAQPRSSTETRYDSMLQNQL